MRIVWPAWWFYPEQCENGHPWAPGLISVSFTRCDCPPIRAAYGDTGGLGHLTVACRDSLTSDYTHRMRVSGP